MKKHYRILLVFLLLFSFVQSALAEGDSEKESENISEESDIENSVVDDIDEESEPEKVEDEEEAKQGDESDNNSSIEDELPEELAEDGKEINEDESVEKPSEIDSIEEEKEVELTTDVTYTKGFHINVNVPVNGIEDSYIPNFTLELWSLNDKLISSAQARSNNFNEETSEFNLVFDHKGFSPDEEIAIVLRHEDPTIDHILFTNYELLNEEDGTTKITEFDLKNGTHFIHKVELLNYSKEELAEWEEETSETYDQSNAIVGSKDFPVQASLEFKEDIVALYVKDGNGKPAVNTGLKIHLENQQGTFTTATDSRGYAFIDRGDLTSVFLVEAVGNGLQGEEFINLGLSAGRDYNTVKVYSMQFDFVSSSGVGQDSGAISLNLETKANTDLTTSWAYFTLVLEDNEGNKITRYVDRL